MTDMVNTDAKLIYEPDNFNGVLFLLREPGGGKTDCEATEGSRRWFVGLFKKDNPGRVDTRYRNRFLEMLDFVNRSNICDSAFSNIKLSGGEAAAGIEYWTIDPDTKKEIVNNLIHNNKNKIDVIFTCSDIYEAVCNDATEIIDGLTYTNGKVKRACKYQNVCIFEMIHPCISPKIKSETAVRVCHE